MPFKRCLAFQASQSRHSALCQGRISPLDVPEINGSGWSNNSYLDRVEVSLLTPRGAQHICHVVNFTFIQCRVGAQMMLYCVGLLKHSLLSFPFWANGLLGQHTRGRMKVTSLLSALSLASDV